MKILVATHNKGKLGEYAGLLAGIVDEERLEWVSLKDVGITHDVEETGQTFEENARLKAVAYAKESGLLTLADDSGLEVDVLNGEPGIYSARYGGPGLDDEGRYRLLLKKLKGVEEGKRGARFRCVVALVVPGGEIYTAGGQCEGSIIWEPEGENGFGYDPVFMVSEKGVTMASLDSETKNQISHRARALEALKPTFEVVLRQNLS